MSNKSIKMQQLQNFLDAHKHLPKQGTLDWINARKTTIGGSEIGILEGTNHFSNIEKLRLSKLGLHKFAGNIWTRLGNMFENVTTKFLELQLQTDIFSTGSVPGLRDNNNNIIQTYSPDGLATVEIKLLSDMLTKFGATSDSLPKLDYANVLFEIKSPGSRIPTAQWSRKTLGYKSQILSGLCTIKECDICLYCDSVIRVCKQLDDTSSCHYVNEIQAKNIMQKPPIFFGVILIKQSNPKLTLENIPHLIANYKRYTDSLDDVCLFSEVLEKAINGDFSFEYHYFSAYETANEFIEWNKDNIEVVTIVPWKMFDIKFIIVHREEDYLDKMKPQIERFFAQLNEKKEVSSHTEHDEEFLKLANELAS